MCLIRSKAGTVKLLKLLRQMQGLHVSFFHFKGRVGCIFNVAGLDVAPSGPWAAFALADGKIVTGANPASAHMTAEEAVKVFDKP